MNLRQNATYLKHFRFTETGGKSENNEIHDKQKGIRIGTYCVVVCPLTSFSAQAYAAR